MERKNLEFDPYSTPPKLTLNFFPSFSKRAELRDMPGMATPPIRLPGAIPFGWEDAPGRPKQKPNQKLGSASIIVDDADRRLGLPPRLTASATTKKERRGSRKNAFSPSLVFARPYFLIRRRSLSLSFGKHHLSLEKNLKREASSDRSSEDTPKSSASSSFSSFKSFSTGSVSSYYNGGVESGGEEEETKEVDEEKEEQRKVRILRCKKQRSLNSVTSYAASQFWSGIIGRLKQTAFVQCLMDPKI